ncbi:hypothetical protein AD006_06635 [Pseudonocardia sp. EC080610-09]|uniref:hypothetical protein n=1 Tax=unclassified Pseudonocardia TaxID=2619320 RepID=UPI0006CB0E7A|nr:MULTISPECIES: hypothetical protein [unclassified Pseudonocardia]ALE75678.1 hypothetical protein FRP1_27455 [Pseudonocardia sp. EC080625-04]ALL75060.1 hypothetical protein AD006_06635 [Pseudonocardia sp. EC080610-09]ALL82081.1 hypothetical protein AD017_14450 [Pseudonocardia sp. EC080619-01]
MSATTTSTGRSVARRFLNRWPAVAGIVVAVLSAAAADGAAPVLVAAGFVYLGAAALGRPGAAWPMFWLAFVVIAVSRFVPGVEPVPAMLVVAGVLLVAGLVRGALRPAGGMPLQVGVLAAVGGLAFAASTASPQVAGLIVAAGLLGHAGWDLWHHRTGRVVSRSLAEFCGVLDAVLAALVLWATFG